MFVADMIYLFCRYLRPTLQWVKTVDNVCGLACILDIFLVCVLKSKPMNNVSFGFSHLPNSSLYPRARE